jgi:hypothetical protein
MARSDFAVKIEGDTSLRLALAYHGDPKRIDKAIQTASVKAMRPVASTAKKLAPVLTGRLRGAISARAARYSKPGAIATIKPGKKRSDLRGAYYRYIVVRGVDSRRISPNPFMDRAFSAKGGEALKIFEKTIEELITKQLVAKR